MTMSPEEGLQVLVVDDDTETEYICRHLSTSRYKLEVSNNVASGLERLQTAMKFDMVVVDFVLDVGTAIEFIAEARKIRPDIPYVIWSVSSGEDILKDLPSYGYGLSVVVEAGISGFAEKQEVQTSSDAMAAFLEEAYQRQVQDKIRPALLGAFKQLEVALSHTRSVSRSIDQMRSSVEPLKPIKFRLAQIESIVRSLLGYNWYDEGTKEELASNALDEILVAGANDEVPSEVQLLLQALIQGEKSQLGGDLFSMLQKALSRAAKDGRAQRAVASRTAEVVEFMIYAGERKRAAHLSGELWKCANADWGLAPRISCGITHAYALASSGSPSLAEHLVSAILLEAEAAFPEASYNELARSVFAELEQFSETAVASV